MRSKLIIDGNAVYEIDEDCMLQKDRERQRGKESGFEGQTDPCREKTEKDGREDRRPGK